MLARLLNSPIDWFVLLITVVLAGTGVITIYTITFQAAPDLASNQILFGLIGLAVTLTLAVFDYRRLRALSGLIYLVGLLLLIPLLPPLATKLPFTLKIFGAYRWLDLGFFQLQPSEIVKLVAIIFSSALLANYVGRLNWRRTITYIALAIVPVVFVILQPDLGTAAVITASFAVVFFAALPRAKTVLVLVLAAALLAPLAWSNLKPYQRERVQTFLNPTVDPQGQGYNVRQSLIAIGSGGLTGRGFGQGSQTVLNFLPVAHTDFIFAGYAEATGFIGSIVLLMLYVALIYRATIIAREADDNFGQLLAIGIAGKFLFQVGVHMGMNLGLLPVTGIPLPFLSYGGTSLITDFAAVGILLSIHIRHQKISFR